MTILLIGAATWKRIENNKAVSEQLVAIQNADTITLTEDDAARAALAEALQPDAASTTAQSSISTTDLVSRQIFSDYLNIAANGQATDESLSALGDAYASKLGTLTSFTPRTKADIGTVADAQKTFEDYGQAVTTIYTKYQNLAGMTIKAGGDLTRDDNPKFASTMSALGLLYKRMADELTALPTPKSLADTHLKLINNYLSSAGALGAIAGATDDAMSSLSALSVQSANTNEEQGILESLKLSLFTHGVSFSLGS
ncbi:hypothetical protein KW785_02795 [Candidatus Parcubacteria bacterium]|nr:hypothetical protein [Candidatus Parcubacteria bacterium]